jgi:uncharacterized protein
MVDETPDVTVRDNPEESRYEVDLDGDLALIAYRLGDATITYTHTEVPEALEGRGIASAMVRFVLDDARARGLRVRPLCPFVESYIGRHPEYKDLVAP